MIRKPKIAIESITGCAGCQLNIYFLEDVLLDLVDKVEIVSARMIKGENEYIGKCDYIFVEGSVCSESDLEDLKKWREQAKFLVALGTCATHGNMQQMKNLMDAQEVEKEAYTKTKHLKSVTPTPIHKHVTVDYSLSGCPPYKGEILRFMKDIVLGNKPRVWQHPVCEECVFKENNCFLEMGKSCMGPLTRGGCEALCPGVNHPCTGCHGPTDDVNLASGIKLFKEKGFNMKQIQQELDKYAGTTYKELEKTAKCLKK
ncbi:MAG: oxidoreductase [archaeon]